MLQSIQQALPNGRVIFDDQDFLWVHYVIIPTPRAIIAAEKIMMTMPSNSRRRTILIREKS